jgi:hypothetical protein
MKKICLQALIVVLLVGVLPFFSWTSARADEMTCPDHQSVTIDVKPGNDKNRIKLSSKGVIAVAVLATPDFIASQFTPQMAHLSDTSIAMTEGCSGASAVRWSLDDENGDGQLDLVFFFNIQDLNFTLNSTSATLMAHGTYDSTTLHIMDEDPVTVVP